MPAGASLGLRAGDPLPLPVEGMVPFDVTLIGDRYYVCGNASNIWYYDVPREEWVPLVKWPTTVGGWRLERERGRDVWKYKESPAGPGVWQQIHAAPVWLPPASTPDADLLLERIPPPPAGQQTYGTLLKWLIWERTAALTLEPDFSPALLNLTRLYLGANQNAWVTGMNFFEQIIKCLFGAHGITVDTLDWRLWK